MPPQTKNRAPRSISLEQALTLLQQAGYTIAPPNLPEVAEKRRSAVEALGLKPHSAFAPRPPKVDTLTRVTLTCQHSVNGVTYGPGDVTIRNNPDLLAYLKSQDQAALASEARLFEPQGRCYLIVEKRDSAGRRAPYAAQVNPSFFDGGYAENAPLYREFSHGDT